MKPLREAASLTLLALGALGCGGRVADARSQWLVEVSTDAPLPQFGDRILLELVTATGEPACAGCRRELGVPEKWPVSFGIEPPSDVETLRVRARLFRQIIAGSDGLPQSNALIEATGSLPEARGVTRVSLLLSASCFGIPSDLASRTTCDPKSATLGPEPVLAPRSGDAIVPGSAELARDERCSGKVPDDMVCVEGGSFILGSPRTLGTGGPANSLPERLVTLSPFLLDRDELSVGQYRSLLVSGAALRPPVARALDPMTAQGACTWLGPDAADNDAMPVNCMGLRDAAAACAALGKRLPTEAEWEFAAGNRRLESTYPWGEDTDACAKAIVGRGRTLSTFDAAIETPMCRNVGSGEPLPAGPVAGGSSLDVTVDPPGILNLGGSMQELVSDSLSAYSDDCWSSLPLVDPHCDTGGATQSMRGGGWTGPPALATAAMRNGTPVAGRAQDIGFRCAKDAKATSR